MALKDYLEQLAVLGGSPALSSPRHVGRPNIPDRGDLIARFEAVLDSAWLTNVGPQVERFERAVAALVGSRDCVAVSSGTAALELAVRALRLRGDVIVPSLTFVATAHAVSWSGLRPVFCDVDPTTWTLDPERVESLITDRTTAILGVHLWGRACDIEGLEAVAERHQIAVLLDAAHALACTYRGEPIGRAGPPQALSFHATKVLNTGEGGAVVTNDVELAHRLRHLRNFGFEDVDRVVDLGTNAKLPELSAAMGLSGLESLDRFIAVNRRNLDRYCEGLRDVPGLSVRAADPAECSNHHHVIVEVDPPLAGLTRDELVDVLTAENVLARRYFYPGCHRMEPYRSDATCVPEPLVHTERILERVLSLPTGTAVDAADVDTICAVIRFAVEQGEALGARLRSRV